MRRRMYAAGLGLLVGIAATGCAQERDPINRVQPDALKKSFFLGDDLQGSGDDPVFLTRGYNTAQSYDQPSLFYGTASGVDRIRWEVTENMLIARKAYQLSPGRDDKGVPGGDPNGTVVAAYKITSHFDVRRAYNPGTGEDLNVVEENTSDRPWYEREYMRVDWSTNQVADPEYLELMFSRWFGDPKISPLSYYVNLPACKEDGSNAGNCSEDAPYFDQNDGYFELTNKFWIEPGQFQFSWGSVPACLVWGYLSGGNTRDCNAQSVSIRLSFWKVKPDHDYERLELTKAPEDIVNNFGTIGDSVTVQYGPSLNEYDPAYGYTDKGYHKFATALNIWKKSHTDIACDNNADTSGRIRRDWQLNKDTKEQEVVETALPNGTADQCEGYAGSPGSQCDVFERKCTVPYRDREIKTQLWYTNREMDPDFLDQLDENGNVIERGATEDVVYSWNQLFMTAIAFSREAECRATRGIEIEDGVDVNAGDLGDTPEKKNAELNKRRNDIAANIKGDCHASYFGGYDGDGNRYSNPKVMVSYGSWLLDDPNDHTIIHTVCHNPVRNYDDPQCGPVGFRARLGDLRKLFLINWPYASNAPFGGVASLHTDPVSGEIIGNTAFVPHVDRRARYFIEPLLVTMGDMSLEEYLQGGVQAKYAQISSLDSQMPQKPSQERLDRNLESLDLAHLAQTPGIQPAVGSFDNKVAAKIKAIKKTSADPALLAQQSLRNAQLMSPLRGTSLEHDLVDSKWLAGLGLDSNLGIDDNVLEMSSPLRNMDSARLSEMREVMGRKLSQAGYCFTPLDEGMQIGTTVNRNLGQYFKNKYPDSQYSREQRYEAMFHEIRRESFKGVLLHEMGHALGMRHQFSSSWDAMNYMPQYWQLRSNEGQDYRTCYTKKKGVFQDKCVGPRYIDPHTPDELGADPNEPRPALEYYANTSTMEYQSERFSETSGLGTWDLHMTQAVYGRVLETYDPNRTPRATQEKYIPRMWSHLADIELVNDVWTAENPEEIELLGTNPGGPTPRITTLHYARLARDLGIFKPEDCREASDEEKATGKWRVVHGKVCSPFPRDRAFWKDFETTARADLWGEEVLNWHTRADLPTAGDQVRWSYKIGESYSPSYVHTNMVDSGADIYEVTANAIQHFDAQYPVQYFRRGDKSRSTWFIPGVVSEDYFEILRSYHWSSANDILTSLNSYGQELFGALAKDDDWSRPNVESNALAFNALVRHVLVPQPGDFVPRASDPSGVFDASATPTASDFTVRIIDGRFVDEAYDTTASGGGSWDFERFWTRAGFYTEKAYAFLALCDSRPTLSTISRDNYLDGRGVRLNFRNDRPEAFDRLIGGILAEDWASVAPYVDDRMCGKKIDPSTKQEVDETPAVDHCVAIDPVNGVKFSVPGYPLTLTDAKYAEARPGTWKTLYPNIGYQQQIYSAIFSALYARENTDMTLIHKMRIWIDGVEANISDSAFPKPEDQLRFYDPGSGFTYIARRFGKEQVAGRQVEMGISSRVLQRANELVTLSYEVEKDTNGQPVLDEFGRPKLVLDTNGQPKPLDAFTSKRGDLIKYVGLVDGLKQLGHILGQGPY